MRSILKFSRKDLFGIKRFFPSITLAKQGFKCFYVTNIIKFTIHQCSKQVANIQSGLLKNVPLETRSILPNFLGQRTTVGTEIKPGRNYQDDFCTGRTLEGLQTRSSMKLNYFRSFSKKQPKSACVSKHNFLQPKI